MLIYRILSILLFPFLELWLFYRVIKKKEDKKRLKERFGKPSIQRPDGEIIWIHAVSVGEANSAMILIDELLKSSKDISILFTTTSLTSAAIVANKLPDFNGRVVHQFLPIDSYFCVKDFFAFWQFKKVIFIESEIWPNMIYEAKRCNIPSFLVNARISKESFKKWKLASKFGFNVFNYFEIIFAQMKEDQEFFAQLTLKEIFHYGNLKSQAQVLQYNDKKLEELKNQIGDRKFWLAASTHKGEEESIIKVHNKLKESFPDILTLLVIRHPYRADEVKSLLDGFGVSTRSKNENIGKETDFYIADTLGEMGIYYKLADFTFLGGSLLEIGGHNPFEPIKLDCAVISGRGVLNFKEIYSKLERKNACVMVSDVEEIFKTVKSLIESKELCKDLSNKALEVIDQSEDVSKIIVDKILST